MFTVRARKLGPRPRLTLLSPSWSLLRRYHTSQVAPFSLLVPVFGMSSAALLLGEDIGAPRRLAAVLLVGGVALTSLSASGSGGRAVRTTAVAERRPRSREEDGVTARP